jgi:arginase
MAFGRQSAELEIPAGQEIKRKMGGITLVALPYDSGQFDKRMGRGPLRLLDGGLPDHLRAQQYDVEVRTVRLSETFRSEAEALVALQQLATAVVREAVTRERRVLILSGNCGPAALSAICALTPRTTGVVWFDAHADFNTPDTSASGFLDGMALSILTGRCWRNLAARFDAFEPVPEKNVVLIGARDLDRLEAGMLKESAITQIAPARMDLLQPAIAVLAERVELFYVHLDVDVLDESEGRANPYSCGGGLSAEALYTALKLIHSHDRIGVASITAYDPDSDRSGGVRAIIDSAAAILAG